MFAPKSARAASLLFLALAVVALSHLANAASSIERVTESPDHPGKCKDRLSGRFYPNGATWQYEGQCLERRCSFPYVSTFTCGTYSVEPPCVLISDPRRPYPDCCPQPLCPEEALDTNAIY